MNETEYAKLRVQAIRQLAGSAISPLRSPDDLIGRWQTHNARTGELVRWEYNFLREGVVRVGDEAQRWKLNKNGTLSLFFETPPDPTIVGLEEGAVTEERYLAFKTAHGRIVLSNEDTSVVELLSKAGRPGN